MKLIRIALINILNNNLLIITEGFLLAINKSFHAEKA